MHNFGYDRREFLQATGVASASLLLASAVGRAAEAAPPAISLGECVSLTPDQVAERSAIVRHSWDYILKTVASMKDDSLRKTTQDILANPAPPS
jgi:hypothetical protein